jgi:hypothetical protein
MGGDEGSEQLPSKREKRKRKKANPIGLSMVRTSWQFKESNFVLFEAFMVNSLFFNFYFLTLPVPVKSGGDRGDSTPLFLSLCG